MKIRLSRTIRLQQLRRIAAIGRTEKNRSIYLAFLQHIAETVHASVETINVQMLNTTPENQRGKSIVDLLIKDGLVAAGENLTLTDLGNQALNSNCMIEPHLGDFLFTIADDPLLSHKIYACTELFQKREKYKPYQYLKNESALWLKRPTYPTYADEDSVLAPGNPVIYRLPVRNNELLYLYAICECGPALEPSEETCVLEILIDGEEIRIEMVGKSRVEISSIVSASYIIKSLNLDLYGLGRYDDKVVVRKTLSTMNPEEVRSGMTTLTLHTISAGDLGVFDTVEISEVSILIAEAEALQTWAHKRLIDMIHSYMFADDYDLICRNVAGWIQEHAVSPIEFDEIYRSLPTYQEMVSMVQNQTAEFMDACTTRPELRWYFLAPQYLQDKGEEI